MENLKNKIAVVTGGNSGIGYAAAKELKENGATVVITGRRKEAIEKAAAQINATSFVADQTNLNDIDKLVAEVSSQFGTIDILLINAGISQFAPIEFMQEEMFDDIMNVNVKGAYFTLSKFIPYLKENASVILLSSTSASTPSPNISAYSASKAAINAIVKVAALELASRKIRVNAVSPGPVATEIMDKSGIGDTKTQEHILSGIPLARFGNPAEIARLITYLSGSDAAFVTGSEFIIDGGQSI